MVENRVDHFLVAVDDAEHAIGQARRLEQRTQPHRQGRVAFRRLEDEGVAGGDGDAGHPHRDHGGEVERGDAGADADGLTMGENVDAGAGAMGVFTLEHMRDAAAEFDDFKTALDIALRIGEHFAVLGRQDACQIVDLGLHKLLELEHHPGAALRVGRRPGGLCLAGGGDGLFERRRIAQANLRLHLARIGIENVAAASARGDRLAGDEVINDTHGCALPPEAGHRYLRFFRSSRQRCR